MLEYLRAITAPDGLKPEGTLPRAKRGLHTPPGVHIHFTDRLIDRRARRLVLGIPVTSAGRTVADLLRSGGWTEQTDLAVRQAIRRGLTTRRRLEAELPAKWRSRLDGELTGDTPVPRTSILALVGVALAVAGCGSSSSTNSSSSTSAAATTQSTTSSASSTPFLANLKTV